MSGFFSRTRNHAVLHIAGLSRLSSCRFRVCFNTEDERLPRVRIPIRFRGVSRASTLWAYLWARMRSVRAVAL